MDNERFVLSAHGSAGKRENFVFTIPRNIILCTYSSLNVCGYYENWSPTAVCNGTYLSRPVIGRFTGGQTFPNFYLWADGDRESNRSLPPKKKTFNSGVKRCSGGEIVRDIDAMPCIANLTQECRYRTTLHDIVEEISLIQFQEATLRGGTAIAEIHLLICLGDVHPGVMAIMAAQSSGRHCSGSGPGCAMMGGRHRKSRKRQQRKKNRSRSKKPHK